jgi:uncharacterized protein (DUF488 family)
MIVTTVGHGTLSAPAFTGLLRDAGIEIVVDVRRYPGSRRFPQFDRDAMVTWLAEQRMDYRWLLALGGRRRPSDDSPNVGLRNEQFRGYADHMASAEFRSGVDELLAVAAAMPAVIMCAESVWWRCHRRIITDYLLAAGEDVWHIMGVEAIEPAKITPAARPGRDGALVYPFALTG